MFIKKINNCNIDYILLPVSLVTSKDAVKKYILIPPSALISLLIILPTFSKWFPTTDSPLLYITLPFVYELICVTFSHRPYLPHVKLFFSPLHWANKSMFLMSLYKCIFPYLFLSKSLTASGQLWWALFFIAHATAFKPKEQMGLRQTNATEISKIG